jgi:hypothetical protein
MPPSFNTAMVHHTCPSCALGFATLRQHSLPQ